MSSLPSSPTLADLYAWNLFQFDAETLQKLWWTTHGGAPLVTTLATVFRHEGPYRGAQQLPLVLLLVRDRYPTCPSPLLDEVWREKGFSGVWKDMEELWERARVESREAKQGEGDQNGMGEGAGTSGSDAIEDQLVQLENVASMMEKRHESFRALNLGLKLLHQKFQARHQAASTSTSANAFLPVATRTESTTGSEWMEVEDAHRGGGTDAAAKGETEELRGQVDVAVDVW